jgi:hypothetical protein
MDRRCISIVSLAAVVLKLASVPGFTDTGIPLRQEKNVETFLGTILKCTGGFLLVNTSDKVTHRLDSEQEVSQFEGKKVQVTGVLDSANNLIHVRAVAEVA